MDAKLAFIDPTGSKKLKNLADSKDERDAIFLSFDLGHKPGTFGGLIYFFTRFV
jgi:hypothetical protein